MKSKEEMIEIMSEAAYLVRYPSNLFIGYQELGEEDKEEIRQEQEAALKALCGALPDVSGKDGIMKRASKEMNIYNQLKQWGKE